MRTRMPLNQNGMSLTAVLIVTAMVGIAATTVLTQTQQIRKVSKQMNFAASADRVKQKLVGAVLSPQSWQIIQAKNTKAFGGFNASAPPMINIYMTQSTKPFYETTNPAAGFDLQGTTCANFKSQEAGATLADTCPFRYIVTLKNRVFQNGNWIDTIGFEMKFYSKEVAFNPNSPQFTFDLVRNINDKSVESACIAINGTYEFATNKCSVTITTAVPACTGNATYRGPGTNASLNNCDPTNLASITCTSPQVLKGFDGNGGPLCGMPL